jgi:hypothetical protein
VTGIPITPYQNYVIIIIHVTKRYTSLTVYHKITDMETIRNFKTENPRQLIIEGDNISWVVLENSVRTAQ